MDRRKFLRSLVGGVAVAAAVRTWPFRVYSFPTPPELFYSDSVIPLSYSFDGRRIHAVDIDALQALELETFRAEIPTLIYKEARLLRVFRQSGVDGQDMGRGSMRAFRPGVVILT